MNLKEILDTKGTTVYCIGPQALLEEAIRELVRHNVGSLVVLRSEAKDERPVGIITERDVLRQCAADNPNAEPVKVADVMSTELITASPDDGLDEVMGIMTTKRIRHLPVCAKGRLVGMISIGDVVKAQHDQLAMENQFMKKYISS